MCCMNAYGIRSVGIKFRSVLILMEDDTGRPMGEARARDVRSVVSS